LVVGVVVLTRELREPEDLVVAEAELFWRGVVELLVKAPLVVAAEATLVAAAVAPQVPGRTPVVVLAVLVVLEFLVQLRARQCATAAAEVAAHTPQVLVFLVVLADWAVAQPLPILAILTRRVEQMVLVGEALALVVRLAFLVLLVVRAVVVLLF
jgi:hypothetical protein